MRRLAAFVLAAALAVAALPAQEIGGPLRVRAGSREQVVATVTDGGARFVPLAALARTLGGTVRSLGRGIVAFDAAGLSARVTVGAADVQVGDARERLDAVARTGAAGVLVHERFVTDLLPRFGTGVVWDPEERELRQFSTFARRAAPPPLPARGAPASASADEGAGDAPDPIADVASAGGAADRTLRPDPGARPVRTGGGTVPAAATRPVDERPAPAASTATVARRRARSVVIDAGHGGPDAGMSGTTLDGRRVTEKEITLAVALLVGDLLREKGVQVHFTRTRDTLIALGDRGRIANQRRADLFMSIHVNAANPGWRDPAAARGFETYFLAEAKTEDESRVEQMENSAVRFETGVKAGPNDPLGFIINDMAQNEHLRESNELAGIVQRRVKGVHPGPDRGVKQANFAVLRTSFMPAVLIEIGFGTNRAEASFLTERGRQRELAQAIAEAAMDYLARYERRVGGGAP